MSLTIRSIGSLVVIFLTVSSLTAQVVTFGNFPPSNDTIATVNLTDLRQKALSITMPAGPNIDLSTLLVRLGDYDSVADGPSFQIRNHTGSTTDPGTTVLATFVAPAPGGAAIQDYTFTLAGSFQMQAGTQYWLVGLGAAGGSVDWHGSSPSITPTGFATYGGQARFSADGGTSWGLSTTINSFQLSGQVVAVPEPTSLALMGLTVLAGLLAFRRW